MHVPDVRCKAEYPTSGSEDPRMARGRIKTEHAGAKNGGGHWGTRAEAKWFASRARRRMDRRDVEDQVAEATEKADEVRRR
jgi:hypothetical protein